MNQTRDIIGDLLVRNLVSIVEEILNLTDARTLLNCCLVCQLWEEEFTKHQLWRRLVEMRCRRNKKVRLALKLNGWCNDIPGLGGMEKGSKSYINMFFKLSSLPEIISERRLGSKKLFTGSMFSCLHLHRENLFAGMLDGLIKMWVVKVPIIHERPIRMFEGHEQRVTALDSHQNHLISSSIDHSVRVWNIETGRQVRVLRGPCSPLLYVKLTTDRIVSIAKSGHFNFWYWNSPKHLEYLYSTSINHDLNFLDVSVGETYIILVLFQPVMFLENEIQVYSSKTGRRLTEKRITCPANISSIAVFNCILCIGTESCIEVWNIEDCEIITILRVDLLPVIGSFISNPTPSIKDISLNEFLLVVMFSPGTIFIWSIFDIVQDLTEPRLCIENNEPSWKPMALSDTKIVFGLEMKFGDIKIYSFSDNHPRLGSDKIKDEELQDGFDVSSPELMLDDVPDLK